MKITAIKKNRDEKGSRAEFLGSNAHSTQSLYLDLRWSHLNSCSAGLTEPVWQLHGSTRYKFQYSPFKPQKLDAFT